MGTVTRIAACATLLLLPGCESGSVKGEDKSVTREVIEVAEASSESKSTGTIRNGQTVSGRLEESDPRMNDGTLFDVWYYVGEAGQRIAVTMSSEPIDSYLLVFDADGNLVGQNDDYGLSLNSRIEITLESSGEYLVAANAVNRTDTGDYTVSMEVSRDGVPGLSGNTDWATLYPGGGDPDASYALLVGISDYPGEVNDLTGPREDARIIQSVLIEHYGFRAENVVLLTDDEGNRAHIANAFDRHLSQAGPGGLAVFYYSGHGTQMEGNHGQLDDEPDGKDEALAVWGSGGSGILLDDELGYLVDRLSAGRVLILLDACFSGTGTRGPDGEPKGRELAALVDFSMPDAFMAPSTGIASDVLGDPETHVLLSASDDDEVAYTAGGWPRFGGIASVFTYYLAVALTDAGPDLTLEQLGAQVRDQSVRYSLQTYGVAQTPQTEGVRKIETVRSFLGGR